MLKPALLSVSLLLCLGLHAQMMPFKNYGIKDGLFDNNVQAVIRDDRGLLWVGTDFGVNWFDGKHFYQPQIKTRIGQLYVNHFYKDWKGAIWTLTFFNGVIKYENGRFSNFLVDPLLRDATTNTIDGMCQVSDEKYIIINQNCPYWFDGKTFSIFDAGNSAVKTTTNAVVQLPDGTLLLATDNGIYLYRNVNGTAKFFKYVLKGFKVTQVLPSNNQLVIETARGLLSFPDSGATSFDNPQLNYIIKKTLRNTVVGKNGAIWAVNDNGSMWSLADTVFKIQNGKTSLYMHKNGLPENVQQIYCDNQGLVWFANRKGICLLSDEFYEFNVLENNRSSEPILALAADQQNNLWIGKINGLVLKKNDKYIFSINTGREPAGYISWLYREQNGSILAGAPAGVLSIKNSHVKKKFNIHSTAVCRGGDNKVWFGGVDGQVWQYDGKNLIHFKIENALNEMVTAMYADKKHVWLGYRDWGVVRYVIKNDILEQVAGYDIMTGYQDMRIRCCCADEHGNLVWGTRTNGAFVISLSNGALVAHINTQKGLNANWIRDIKCDTGGKLYFATNSGVDIVSGDYRKPIVKYIKINDDNINRETNCILKMGNVFYIGTNQGILKWIPANIYKDTAVPPVYFTKIGIQGLKSFSVEPYTINAGEITLPYDQHFISFEFAGISLKNPENVLYHYMLSGQDNEWSPVTEHNDVAYNLKPGNYTFKVIAENADGVWSKHPAVFHFIITPPFWQRWWFMLMVAIAFMLIAYSVYRYQLSKKLALELLRNKISTDLHDDIGSTLSSISILSEVAVREKEQKSKRMLGEINERSHSLMEKMDDIVWSISTRNDTVGNLFIRIQQFASSILEAKDIDYEVNIPDRVKDVKLDMQRRQHIYLILKEAINNLVKYSCCTAACITAAYVGHTLKIEVTDNGKGFDMNSSQHGNGLYNMKKRAEVIRGSLSITSAPGQGTKVTLVVQIE